MLTLTQDWAKPTTVWLAMKGEVHPDELADIPAHYTKPIITRLHPPFESAVKHLVNVKVV